MSAVAAVGAVVAAPHAVVGQQQPGGLTVTPSTLQVDYDTNLTELYKAITDQKWEKAIQVCEKDPIQAAIWVVRHYREEDGSEDPEIMWRFLPLHSACARQPPKALIQALLRAYPDAAACVDDQGMYALHYAAGNQASFSIIDMLVKSCRPAIHQRDPRGMLPLHYLACWGPSDLRVLDLLITAKSCRTRDIDGNVPLDLAYTANYPEREAVIRMLKHVAQKPIESETNEEIVTHNSTKKVNSYQQPIVAESPEVTVIEERQPVDPVAAAPSSALVSPPQAPRGAHGERDDVSTAMSRRSGVSVRSKKSIKGVVGKERSPIVTDVMDTKMKSLMNSLEASQREVAAKTEALELLKEESQKTKEELSSSKSESEGLRRTLGDLMEQHQALQLRFKQTQDRLSVLSISLESMNGQQQVVKDTFQKHKEAEMERTRLLEQLVKLKVEFDEGALMASMKKQVNEMEAIAAIIKAAKD